MDIDQKPTWNLHKEHNLCGSYDAEPMMIEWISESRHYHDCLRLPSDNSQLTIEISKNQKDEQINELKSINPFK